MDDERTESKVSKELLVELERELLRGVPLHVALSGWAKHWSTDMTGMLDIDRSLYGLSQQTEEIDTFLSHDWGTSRWSKLLAMLILFNSRPAALVCLVTSLLLGLAATLRLLPPGLWMQMCGHLAFLISLCFWQRIRYFLGKRPRLVFLDKVCINQADPRLKERGILGLASFLNHSDTLAILWSPRYFERLWCTYEIAAFLRWKKSSSIKILPVTMALALFLLSAVMMAFMLLYHQFAALPEVNGTRLVRLLMALFGTVIGPFQHFWGMAIMDDLQKLRFQLQHFSIRASKCFCCSNSHKHPETGDRLSCDRRLVLRQLQKWFGASEDDEEYMELFDRLVREKLSSIVMDSIGNGSLPLNYSFYMVVSAAIPALAIRMPEWFLTDAPDTRAQATWFVRHFVDWAKLPLLGLFYIRCLSWLWQLGRRCRWRRLAAVCMTPLSFLVLAAGWLPVEQSFEDTDDFSLLPVLPFSAFLLLVLYLWRKQLPRWGRSQVLGEEPAERCQDTAPTMEPAAEKKSTDSELGDTLESDVFEV